MIQNKFLSIREKIITKIVNGLKVDQRILLIFASGSMNSGLVSKFSDIDLWIVLSEESGINLFKTEIFSIFSKFFKLSGVYKCTEHHYFVICSSGIQIDLNITTAAQYFSLIKIKDKRMLFDRNHFISKTNNLQTSRENFIKEKLLIGSTTLERGINKFIKGDYFVAVRFLESVRNSSILPLLPLVDKEKFINIVSFDIKNLNIKHRILFEESFARPTKESCLKAIISEFELLVIIKNRLKIKEYNSVFTSIDNFIKKNKL
jgi:predicted nucleotidyltransferase